MKKQNARRGFTQEVVTKNCHSKFNLESHRLLLYKVKSRIKYGMTPLFNNGGFTLIELLVVVLIIGILAAIALPQYQKAVAKSRATQIVLNMSALQRAVDLYALSDPDLTGVDYVLDNLDIDPFSIFPSYWNITESREGSAFHIDFICMTNDCATTPFHGGGDLDLWRNNITGEWVNFCSGDSQDILCNELVNQGWMYFEETNQPFSPF